MVKSDRELMDVLGDDENRRQCKFCFQKVCVDGKTFKGHVQGYHSYENIQRDPYIVMIKSQNCPMGCSFISSSIDSSEMRMHLIISHSYAELRNWNINRNYLKF